MTDTLVVHVNEDDHHSLSPERDPFEPTGSFVVRLQNHGDGSHVHVSVEGDLAIGGGVDDPNPYLEPGEQLDVQVAVRTDIRPATGTVELSTGYGRESRSIHVTVGQPGDAGSGSASPTGGGSDPAARTGSGSESTTPADGGGAGDQVPSGPGATSVDPPWGGGDGDTGPGTGGNRPDLDAVRELPDRVDEGTLLLALLALLAILVAAFAVSVFDGVVVRLGVVAVLATILGAAAYLIGQ